MNRQGEISEKELKLLCEYIDDALSIKDRAKFEKRLQQSPELKQALADMTALKHNMRSLPVRKVPHQFTLTRSEAEKARRGRFLLPSFGWASVVSMILLAVIFGSEFIFTNFSAPQPVAEPLAMTMQYEAAPESALRQSEEEDAEPVYLLNWASGFGKGGGGGGGGGGVAYGIGGGSDAMVAEGIAIAEPIQPEEFAMSEPAPLEEGAEATEVPSTLAHDKVTVEPLIFGVREDQLGQVIAFQPNEAPVLAFADAPEVVEAEQEPLIPMNVKWILAGLATAFGLIWLFIRYRR